MKTIGIKLIILIIEIFLLNAIGILGPYLITAEEIEEKEPKIKITLEGRVLNVNAEHNFVVINLGNEDGIMPGTFLAVYRNDKKIGEIQVVRTREKISAADIKRFTGTATIEAGDIVIGEWVPEMAKQTKALTLEPFEKPLLKIPPLEEKREIELPEKEKRGRKLPVKEKREIELPEIKVEIAEEETKPYLQSRREINTEQPPAEKPKSYFSLEKFKLFQRSKKPEQVGSLRANINTTKDMIFYFLNQVLREHGFIITGYKKKEGLLTAQKDINFSIAKELWADVKGEIDHEVIYSIKIEEGAEGSRLIIHLDGGYKKSGQYRRLNINSESPIYKEAVEVVQTIKERAELGIK